MWRNRDRSLSYPYTKCQMDEIQIISGDRPRVCVNDNGGLLRKKGEDSMGDLYVIVYLGMFLAFLFPWFLCMTIQKMIKNEKYGFVLTMTCISFGTSILSILIMLS